MHVAQLAVVPTATARAQHRPKGHADRSQPGAGDIGDDRRTKPPLDGAPADADQDDDEQHKPGEHQRPAQPGESIDWHLASDCHQDDPGCDQDPLKAHQDRPGCRSGSPGDPEELRHARDRHK
ncbi:MAG: hypothetical protein IPH81_05075 [Candidatus Microthrix sp.]|nr:hypothetical protein [Candidatus Microthrix sp.]